MIPATAKKIIGIVISLAGILTAHGQAKAVNTGSYAISCFPLHKTLAAEPNLLVKFTGPMNQPVKSHVKLFLNNDSLVPVMDSSGIFRTTLPGGKYRLKFCVPFWHTVVTDSILLKADEQVFVIVHFDAKPLRLPGILYGLGKPVIYVYPEKPTQVRITLQVKDSMVFSYPRYEQGWDFMAEPSGNIRCRNRNYAYLFWEGSAKMSNLARDWSEGFFVRSDTLTGFLERALSASGLNEREAQDFITFWAPKMQANAYNYLHFVFNKDYDQLACMQIEPKPDNLLRVFMLWSGSREAEVLPLRPQAFPKFNRKGFTIVEWGGGELPDLFKHIN